jgi:hypothetical protein
MVANHAAPREEPDMIEKAPPPGTAGITKRPAGPLLERTTLRTSRLLDFCSQKELVAQTGYRCPARHVIKLPRPLCGRGKI